MKQCFEHRNSHVCSIIPPNLLQHILNANENSDNTKAAAKKTFNHVCKLQTSRVRKDYRDYHHHSQAPTHGFTAGIIPPQIFKAALASEDTSSETKERAQNQLKGIEKLHSARADQAAELKKPTAHVYRSLYTSAKTDTINKTLLFEEGADTKVVGKDIDASEVYDFFGKTYQFYSEVRVFGRPSYNISRFCPSPLRTFIGSIPFLPNPTIVTRAFRSSNEIRLTMQVFILSVAFIMMMSRGHQEWITRSGTAR